MKMNNKPVLLTMIFFLIALTGCGSGGSAPEAASVSGGGASSDEADAPKELTEITVGTTASGIAYGAIYLAQEENIWEKYGLKVNLISMEASAVPPAVINGDVPIVNGTGSGIINAAIQTDKVKVSGTLGLVPFMLYSGKDIQSLEDLKGKVIGVSPGSSTEYAAITMLESIGMELGKDVEALQVFGGSSLTAISEGKIDAGFLVPPMSIQADKLGLNHLATLSEMDGIRGMYMVGGYNVEFAEKHPEVITNYYKAYKEAVLLTRTEKEKTKAALAKWTKVEDEEALEFAYNYFVDYWPTEYRIPEEEVQFILDQLAKTTYPDARNVKMEDLVDNQYVDKVD